LNTSAVDEAKPDGRLTAYTLVKSDSRSGAPALVGDGYRDADHLTDDRTLLLTAGKAEYTENGIIGLPPKASAEKPFRALSVSGPRESWRQH
jgi:hypothetical protein